MYARDFIYGPHLPYTISLRLILPPSLQDVVLFSVPLIALTAEQKQKQLQLQPKDMRATTSHQQPATGKEVINFANG